MKWSEAEVESLRERIIRCGKFLNWSDISTNMEAYGHSRSPAACRRKWARLEDAKKSKHFVDNGDGTISYFINGTAYQPSQIHTRQKCGTSDDQMWIEMDKLINPPSPHRLPRVYVAGAYGGNYDNVIRHLRVMRELSKIKTISLCSWSWMAVWNEHCLPPSQISEKQAIEVNMRELSQCDAIIIGAGEHLNESKGTQGELDESIRTGKPVFTCIESLKKWASGWGK